MRTLFALQGVGTRGKSSTLRLLIEKLRAKYPAVAITYLHSRGKDHAVIMRKVKRKVIGVECQGDPGSRLKETLDVFVEEGCDIIFCACRSRGETVDWVNALAHAYKIHFVPQTCVTRNFDSANAKTVALLMQLAGL